MYISLYLELEISPINLDVYGLTLSAAKQVIFVRSMSMRLFHPVNRGGFVEHLSQTYVARQSVTKIITLILEIWSHLKIMLSSSY